MFYSTCQELLVKGLIRVEGRPDGIHIVARSFKHRLMVKCLSRNERLMLAGLQAERRQQAARLAQEKRAHATTPVTPLNTRASDSNSGDNPTMQRTALPKAANY